MNAPEFPSKPYDPARRAPESTEPEFRGGHPLLTIWVRPRATLRHILNTDPRRGVWLLAMLQGVGQVIAQAVMLRLGNHYTSGQIVALSLVAGPFVGLLWVYVLAALFQVTGSWLGGSGTTEDVRAALAWSCVPSICSLLLLIPEYALVGREMFLSDAPRPGAGPGLWLLFGISGVLALWSFVLELKCLGEAHRFSSWKALGAVLLGGLVFVAIVLPAVLVLVLLSLTARLGR